MGEYERAKTLTPEEPRQMADAFGEAAAKIRARVEAMTGAGVDKIKVLHGTPVQGMVENLILESFVTDPRKKLKLAVKDKDG